MEKLISICCVDNGVIYSALMQNRNRIFNHLVKSKIWNVNYIDNFFF